MVSCGQNDRLSTHFAVMSGVLIGVMSLSAGGGTWSRTNANQIIAAEMA